MSVFLISIVTVGCRPDVSQEDEVGIVVHTAVAPAPLAIGGLTDATVAVYLTLQNRQRIPDTLDAVQSPLARSAMVHSQMQQGGMAMMMPSAPIAIPARDSMKLAPGGTHIMLENMLSSLLPGDTIPLFLTFRHSGRIPVKAVVVTYQALDSALGVSRTRVRY